jgi:phosphoribosylaminoimidazole-succinocarboxamide synthase
MQTTAPLFESHLTSLPLIGRGKVRDLYAVGADRLLMVACDRLSAYDVVMTEPIPGKGELLTRMAMFWFGQLADIVPNHLTGEDPESVVCEQDRASVKGRSMLVRRLQPIPVEAVVRGYLAGSSWIEYQRSHSVCGVQLPPALQHASRLPHPIFTPATKAAQGEHDENISFERMCGLLGNTVATRVKDISIQLYDRAAAIALPRGIIIADTKFEFGLDESGTVTLMDEVLTPDSSRFWPSEQYVQGINPPNFDKQHVRDWLERATVNGKPWDRQRPAPSLPREVIESTTSKYREAMRRLQG